MDIWEMRGWLSLEKAGDLRSLFLFQEKKNPWEKEKRFGNPLP